MRALTGELLLSAWDQCTAEHDLDRALTVLALSLPGSSRQQISQLSIGDRNLQLARLHALTFGPWLNGFAACPACGARLEFRLSVAALMAQIESQLSTNSVACTVGDAELYLRPVTSEDLLAALAMPDAEQAQEILLTRCLQLSASAQGESGVLSSLIDTRDLREKFNQLNRATEVLCATDCPECSSRQMLDLDLARFVSLEIKHAALRLLSEIHELASAYGWSEQSIAGMSSQRRNAYMETLSACV
jgi:hypothetical protein